MAIRLRDIFGLPKLRTGLAFLASLVTALFVTVQGTSTAAVDPPEDAAKSVEANWVLQPSEARALVADGGATVLDTRSESAWRSSHVPGAVRVAWEDFSPEAQSRRGTLLSEDDALQKKLRALGVSDARAVVVVGASDGGWGEAGRIVWMLRTLGHQRAGWVDGGHAALVEAGIEPNSGAVEPEAGDFTVQRRSDWTIDRERLRSRHDDKDVVVLDTRRQSEFAGATPYGAERGGHIPGAAHLHFKELLGEDGRLLREAKIRAKLRERGVAPDATVVAYCTGGVRSAWLTTVLVDLGYEDVRNYPGSMWEWSAKAASTYPLVPSKSAGEQEE